MGGSVTEEHLTTIYHKRPRIAQQFATRRLLAGAALLALHRSFRGPFEIPQGLPTNGRVPIDSQSMTASELSGKAPYRYRNPPVPIRTVFISASPSVD